SLPGLTHEGLWAAITAEVKARFRHELVIWGKHLSDEKALARAHKIPLLRRVCRRIGIRVLSKAYDMSCPEPLSLECVMGVFPLVKV
ncbi:unnamed protein product, partial [Choristocarpus tenellus]